jgi:uncharacterized lipoprotein YmbA
VGNRLALLLVVVVLGAGVTSCSTRLPRTYILSATSGPAGSTPRPAPVVGVGPVTIPAYLDQAPMVVREGAGEVRLSRGHQWAEPLKDGVARVVAENLALLIPTEAVVLFPWRSPRTVTYRVTMEIFRFDGSLGGSMRLTAQWRLLDGHGKELVLRAVSLDEPAPEPSYAALVAAQDRLLAAVSRDIAAAIRARSP